MRERTRFGRGCLKCSSSLLTKDPKKALEWHPTKNLPLTSRDVHATTSKVKVWWKCRKCNNEWKETPQNKRHCPNCSLGTSSTIERKFFYYIHKAFGTQVKSGQRIPMSNYSMDIFIEKYKLCIEYDGMFFHQNRIQHDKDKNDYIRSVGYEILRIRENSLVKIEPTDINHVNKMDDYTIMDTLKKTFSFIESNFKITNKEKVSIKNVLSIDIKKHVIPAQFLIYPYVANSLAKMYPLISKQWHPTKNLPLKPEMFVPSSPKVVWWNCKVCDSDFEKGICSFVDREICTHCEKKNRDILNKKREKEKREESERVNAKIKLEKINLQKPYFVDLFSLSNKKDINKLLPFDLNNKTKHIWNCEKHGDYNASPHSIYTYFDTHKSCPTCRLDGNSFPEKLPHLIKYWDKEKNDVPMHHVGHTSKVKNYFKCDTCNNNWEDTVYDLSLRKYKCPKCYSFAMNYPDLYEKYWDKEKNTTNPFEVTHLSVKHKFWWKCNVCNYEWNGNLLSVKNIVSCLCNKKLLLNESPSFEGLIDKEKTPNEYIGSITYKSSQVIHWKCKGCEQSYTRMVCRQTNRKNPGYCDKCELKKLERQKEETKQKQLKEREYNKEVINSFGIKESRLRDCTKTIADDPVLSIEWDVTKNKITPDQIPYSTNKKAWWKCHKCSHEWESRIDSRSKGSNSYILGIGKCPVCKHK
jgi:very-short-patch-repair endonuclease